MKTSNFNRYNLYHLCKISFDGSVIFYENSDFLVFITIVFSYAKRYGIRITGLCIMLNHFHIAAYAPTEKALKTFYQQICAEFVKQYNRRDGKIKIKMKRRSNISEKHGDKMKKTAYIYIGNNPVEKKYCNSAADYRWNFFDNVEYKTEGNDSDLLKLAKAIARDSLKTSNPLKYEYFGHYEKMLRAEEMADLTKYVLSIYVSIDTTDIKKMFGTVDSFLHFSESYSGSDHDLEEDMTLENYRHYSEMARILINKKLHGNDCRIHDENFNLCGLVRGIAHHTNSTNVEISRFLHIPVSMVQDITGRQY